MEIEEKLNESESLNNLDKPMDEDKPASDDIVMDKNKEASDDYAENDGNNPTDAVTSSGKRSRKTVVRLNEYQTKSDKKEKSVDGSGTKLGDIERFQLAQKRGKLKTDLLKFLHMLCYRTPGCANKRMASVKKFNGFNKDDSVEVEKRQAFAKKMKSGDLKTLIDLFNITTTSKLKDDIATAVVEFLKSPYDTGSDTFRTAALKVKRKSKKASKDETRKRKGDTQSEKNAKGKKGKPRSSDSEQISTISNTDSSDQKGKDSYNDDDDNDSDKEYKPSKSPVKKTVKVEKGSIKEKRQSQRKPKSVKSKRGISESDSEDSVSVTDADDSDDDYKPGRSKSKKKIKIENSPKKSITKISKGKSRKQIIESDSDDNKEDYDSEDTNSDVIKQDNTTTQTHSPKIESLESENISDEKLHDIIAEILNDADLSRTTMNQVCDRILQRFTSDGKCTPDRHRVKLLIKAYIEEKNEKQVS